MKKTTTSHSARTTLGVILFIVAIGLLCSIAFISPHAQVPDGNAGADTISPGGDVKWSQVLPITTAGGVNNLVTDDSSCQEGINCEHFLLTVGGTVDDWAAAQQKVHVVIRWSDPANEYDIYIHKGSDASGPVVASSFHGPGVTAQTGDIDVLSYGTGPYYVHVAFNTTPDASDHYTGEAAAAPIHPAPIAPADSGPTIGYENFEAPGILQPASQLSSGAITVEYLGRGAGEPSIGANWATGNINFQSDLQTLFVTFDDDCDLSKPKAVWVNRRAPTSQFIDSDPIGFTDHTSSTTNRVFAAELTLLSPDTVKISHTDDDGMTWTPDQTGGLASAVDHETIGGGPYNQNAVPPPPPNPIYPHAIYYCSQDEATALCSRSDDGGQTYGPSIPIYTTECGSLHGHVKVAPDGTVYVPNSTCNTPNGSDSGVVVSTDNGLTWNVRPVEDKVLNITNTAATDDPAVAVDGNNNVYILFSMGGTSAIVSVSGDQGKTWTNTFDVGEAFGLTNVAFPAAVGGSDGRAAVAFYGSRGGAGNSSDDTYAGTWHLYVAHTFDHGAHWTTTDATPSLPMQRMGLLRGGGGPIDRNLLDFFDMTVDKEGRVLVGYVNGCSGADCGLAPVNPDGSTSVIGNTYSATASIARQSSGRRLFASADPNPQTSVPGMPFVTAKRVGPVVHLGWNEADPGNNGNNQLITNFQIFRGTSPNGETATPIATLPGTASRYDDITATDPNVTYYYKVIATNSIGQSCGNNEVAAPNIGDTCSGIIIHRNEANNPEAIGASETSPPIGPTASATPSPAATPPIPGQYLIDYIAVAEPPSSPNQLVFTMKVKGDMTAPPPNSRWRIVWGWTGMVGRPNTENKDEQYYIGMTTDASSAVTFEYGTIHTLSAVVVGVPNENMLGAANSGSADKDGNIVMAIDKSKVGNPAPGDILAEINGRTFNTNGPAERSALIVDHTFVKGNTDNSYPPATYTVTGNVQCPAAVTAASPTPTPSGTPTPTPAATPAQLLNISTRVDVKTGDNVMIAGFILSGNGSDNVLVRALGPSLNVNGTPVQGRLMDPTVELHDSTGKLLAFDDNWKDSQQAAIEATGLAPTDDRESAIVEQLNSAAYTAVMRGAGDSTGIGLVEAYDLNKSADVQFANISTRGFVETGDNVMIGGFIAGPSNRGFTNIIVRGLGPSLSSMGVPNTLQDPVIELHDANGTLVANNDDWATDINASQVVSAGLAPSDPRESALARVVGPGKFTAILAGKNESGNGLVEIYNPH